MKEHILIFDGTSYFVEFNDYQLSDGESIVFSSDYLEELNRMCDHLNESI